PGGDDPDNELEVYYDPVKTTYKTEYWLQNSDGYALRETVTSSEVYVGKTVQAELKTYDGYTHVTTGDSKEEATVEADGATILKVYYDKAASDTAKYKVEYYKLDPDSEKYSETPAATSEEMTGNVGDTITLADVDSGYAGRYADEYYEVNTTRNDVWSVKLEEKDQTYVLKVFYDPIEVTYTIEYYLKKPDGTQEKRTVEKKAYVGKKVRAEVPDYDGYTHVTNGDSLETAVVTVEGTTVLKVYYEAEGSSVKSPTEKPSAAEPSQKPAEKETENKTVGAPKTGDTTNYYIWFIIFLAAAVGECLVIGKTKKE
ncbi:MAG: hypothetical protein HDQ95_13105, partial [Roseburia sp.]|nr:hypothetical protein [Roseburia sp.]